MRDIYINSNLNPLGKSTSSSRSAEFKDILPWNISQIITKTIPMINFRNLTKLQMHMYETCFKKVPERKLPRKRIIRFRRRQVELKILSGVLVVNANQQLQKVFAACFLIVNSKVHFHSFWKYFYPLIC